MFESLIALDKSIFMFLNSGFTNGFLDWFMPFITNAKNWMPIIFISWFYMLLFCDKRIRILAIGLLVSVGLNDLICARILKKGIDRRRPCSIEETGNFKCRLLLPRKSSESFPSNHASNTAAFAAAISFYSGIWAGLPFIVISFLIGYSRIYCGVHFPFDVLAGWLFGTLMSFIIIKLIILKFCYYEKEETTTDQQSQASDKAITE
ncbi:MAG: phosphatase PAP2 family protein [Candidatus Rifleibacteriota bacterium]